MRKLLHHLLVYHMCHEGHTIKPGTPEHRGTTEQRRNTKEQRRNTGTPQKLEPEEKRGIFHYLQFLLEPKVIRAMNR